MDKRISAENFIDYAVNTYSDTVYRVALNITHNPQDSFDISQEVFIRLVKNQEKIKDKEHLKAWLIRVAVNCSSPFMKAKTLREIISCSKKVLGYIRVLFIYTENLNRKKYPNIYCNLAKEVKTWIK